MAFGIQTFNEDGSVDFESNSPHMRVIHKRRVTGSVSFTIEDYAPPYYVIVLMENPIIVANPSEIRWTQSGNTVTVNYVRYYLSNIHPISVNFPALVLVCK